MQADCRGYCKRRELFFLCVLCVLCGSNQKTDPSLGSLALPRRRASLRMTMRSAQDDARSGVTTSTEQLNVRASPGGSAPTAAMWRAISSPRSFLTTTTTEYSHAIPASGWRTVASTRSGVNDDCAGAPTLRGSKRKCFRHAGHTAELCRISVRQCGHVRVAPVAERRTVKRCDSSPT
jgi:hypothetical protein